MTPSLLTRQQAAAYLGVSLRSIDHLATSGDLPTIRIGTAVRIRPSALEYFCEAHETRKPRPAKRNPRPTIPTCKPA